MRGFRPELESGERLSIVRGHADVLVCWGLSFNAAKSYVLPTRLSMKLHSLQAARAIAAWSVIADHALLEITHDQSQNSVKHVAWMLGNFGVYVFFIISGFIMVHICWESFGQPVAAASFLRRRMIRIVPLYWLATVAALAYHKLSATHGSDAGWLELVYSLAFIPYSGDDGSWTPILGQGWTLNYEIMFYLIFALGLSFRRQIALPAVGVILGTLVIIGPLLPNETLTYLASPIVLWFLLGMALATLWHRWDLREPEWLARSSRLLEPLGDASYSTYLAHGLILTVLLRGWVIIAGPPSIWIVPVSMAVATIGGWAIHMVIERPVLRIAASLWKPSREVVSLKVPGAS
jgi:exopolysaccharide production protein ExoZ